MLYKCSSFVKKYFSWHFNTCATGPKWFEHYTPTRGTLYHIISVIMTNTWKWLTIWPAKIEFKSFQPSLLLNRKWPSWRTHMRSARCQVQCDHSDPTAFSHVWPPLHHIIINSLHVLYICEVILEQWMKTLIQIIFKTISCDMWSKVLKTHRSGKPLPG